MHRDAAAREPRVRCRRPPGPPAPADGAAVRRSTAWRASLAGPPRVADCRQPHRPRPARAVAGRRVRLLPGLAERPSASSPNATSGTLGQGALRHVDRRSASASAAGWRPTASRSSTPTPGSTSGRSPSRRRCSYCVATPLVDDDRMVGVLTAYSATPFTDEVARQLAAAGAAAGPGAGDGQRRRRRGAAPGAGARAAARRPRRPARRGQPLRIGATRRRRRRAHRRQHRGNRLAHHVDRAIEVGVAGDERRRDADAVEHHAGVEAALEHRRR